MSTACACRAGAAAGARARGVFGRGRAGGRALAGRRCGGARARRGCPGGSARGAARRRQPGQWWWPGRRFTQRERLVAVTDPVSGERVLTRQALDPVGGWDLVFAAPKSVSLAYALGSEEVRVEVLGAHEAAVTAALGMLERHAAYTRRGSYGVILEAAAGVVVARFAHELARRVEHADGSTTTDPHLHTHCALLGRALSGDGQWRALRHPLIIGEWQKPLVPPTAHTCAARSPRGWDGPGRDSTRVASPNSPDGIRVCLRK